MLQTIKWTSRLYKYHIVTRNLSLSVQDILTRVKLGQISVDEADSLLSKSGVLDVESYARIDTTREARCGFPEVIFGSGKTSEQIAGIMRSMTGSTDSIIASRIESAAAKEIVAGLDTNNISTHKHTYYESAGVLHYHTPSWRENHLMVSGTRRGKVAVLCAGTSDLPVAEECATLLYLTGDHHVERVYDVGVAGIHRLFQKLPDFQDCDVAIVCAGMDGALPSAVGGLLRAPVIAVPTSVGYGAAFNGVAPLLTMLNSCAPGVSVVNIDNGFGAAVMAHKILSGQSRI
jgi:pyridinium-3,5-biscarboxylic acid mononucleotide synthase